MIIGVHLGLKSRHCVCSEKSYRTLFLMHHLELHEESIRNRMRCIFSTTEYYLAILQGSSEKVLQLYLTFKPITANSLASQKQCWTYANNLCLFFLQP